MGVRERERGLRLWRLMLRRGEETVGRMRREEGCFYEIRVKVDFRYLWKCARYHKNY
jgi:hypothetical protein